MKITKKKPLRPRGRSDEKRQSTKDAIREVYANGPQKEVQIIPAKKDLPTDAEKKKLRVCAYCRVSTEEDNQASSYELQVQNYTKMIQENPDWEFAGIFADEGISGTSVLHREHFLEMIEKCKAGEIDLIITKQVSRFARNVLDSLNYIFMLRKLDPPVGVYFETEKLNTLDAMLNNHSIILLLEYGETRILLPGDTNPAGYEGIDPALLKADLFKVGHHGQRDGADEKLLQAVQAKAVVCCANSDRLYHSADPKLMASIRDRGARRCFSDCPPVEGEIIPPHSALVFTVGDDGTIEAEYQ
jgi:hypothetical protein